MIDYYVLGFACGAVEGSFFSYFPFVPVCSTTLQKRTGLDCKEWKFVVLVCVCFVAPVGCNDTP